MGVFDDLNERHIKAMMVCYRGSVCLFLSLLVVVEQDSTSHGRRVAEKGGAGSERGSEEPPGACLRRRSGAELLSDKSLARQEGHNLDRTTSGTCRSRSLTRLLLQTLLYARGVRSL